MDDIYVTITGTDHYYGSKPFEPGVIIKLEKDTENKYDGEAIRAVLPHIGTVGYVANSPSTTFKGTFSAGRLYDKIDSCCYAGVYFVTRSGIIVKIFSKDEAPVSF